MANPQGSMISRLIESFGSLGDDESVEQVKHYEGLVTEELGRVHDVYLVLWDGISNRPEPLVLFNQVEIRSELLHHLKSKRLPALRRQVISLSKLLTERSDLQNKPVSKLKLVLKNLSKLDDTLAKIKFAIACINPTLEAEEVTHDKDFKRLKLFTCRRLATRIYEVTEYVCDLLQTTRRFFTRSGHAFNNQPRKRRKVLKLTDSCSDAIEKTIGFMKASELHHIQEDWRLNKEMMDDSLEKFLEYVNQAAAPSGVESDGPGLSPATKSVMPLIKLSRMFLAQLLKLSSDKENISMVTDLNTKELDLFRTMTVTMAECVKSILYALSEDIGEDHLGVMLLNESIKQLIHAPNLILLMVEHIFVPVVPATDHPSPKIRYKAWFYQWNQLHHLATKHFLEDLGFLPRLPRPW
ncbi:hypothetical protein PTTG_04986 [Puccinia triticina 1-1 BBBD Race 1]|uniref:Uncharacterized protein n=2 Tax=Puccinia triticina TaxID=208348 RepID=A0A180GIX8_PUCT1|nr:uncharacterized protein PtA15_2A831 [Puccinia triticina]OAV92660.1 hypothetical protein PTTG_04986 [Puccinia triticina 1-1 BBBD Race 1]WAQ82514.1 hypothetical protein PtA15_2A831 [Puccinia triticina]WAR53365.1 hypothetical protein PtB15_2B796 [Puccinia triticina]